MAEVPPIEVKVVDLTLFRDAKKVEAEPDGSCITVVFKDGAAVKYYLFTAEYSFDGREWAFEFWAKDEVEAKAKIDAIKANATYSGQIFSIMPA